MQHLTKTIALLSLALSMSLAACGGSSDSCAALNKKLCAGKDAETCKKTRAWLDSELTGPDDKKLSSSEAGSVCKMLMEDKETLDLYVKQAAEKVK